MIKDLRSSAAALYDGGWRASDKEQLIKEHDLSGEEADAICAELKKMDMSALKKWLEKKYGEAEIATIMYEGDAYTGYMYGNDECFSGDDFYQYFLTDDTLYMAFYDIPEGETDLGNLDYANPVDLQDADAQYFIDYVI